MPKIVFLSRGHGYGHAARDLQILESMRRLRPDVDVVLASSGTGLEYYKSRSVSCEDLDIPDSQDTNQEAGKRVWRFLRRQGVVDLVVSDEVLWALPICSRDLCVACVLVTDWFYSECGLAQLDRSLNQATAIVVPDFRAAHPGLEDIAIPLHFTGPLVRRFSVDRGSARQRLGLVERARAAVVTLGGMPQRPEAQAIVDAVAQAWCGRAGRLDRLFVLADRPVGPGSPHDGHITWVGITSTPETYFCAADVVVAEGEGFTVCELAKNRTPVVAIVNEVMNDAARLRLAVLESAGLTTTTTADVGPEHLWRLLGPARSKPSATESSFSASQWADPDQVAAQLLQYLEPNGQRRRRAPARPVATREGSQA
jgi:hypothetical protein